VPDRDNDAQIYAIIPARWASTRFPGKPLHEIAGKPLVQHVWEKCRAVPELAGTVIATDDSRISDAARAFGADVAMTRDDHPSGTDRIAEAVEAFPRATHIINVQGDEPMIDPSLIGELARTLAARKDIAMLTAASTISDEADLQDPNVVKTVLSQSGEALYFSRSVIPYLRNRVPDLPHYRHKGIYGYTREFLLQFVRWAPSPLELAEGLEQLRALENGTRIHVLLTDDNSIGVDVPAQADTVSRLLSSSATSTPSATSP
jgi:3-deoxy-manno-octulosonate cytidylyltransferase (CMP-KDO synthetase)